MQFAVRSASHTLKLRKVHEDSMETAQPVLESNWKLMNSTVQSAVEACKAKQYVRHEIRRVAENKHNKICFHLHIV